MYANTSPATWSPAPRAHTSPTKALPGLLVAVGEADVERVTLPAFTRIVARTTSEAVMMVARERPTAVILDVDLPGLDAAAVCRAACAIDGTSVLVTTGAPEQAPPLLKAGCHAILLKPFATNLLAARLGRLVRERAQHQRLRALRPAVVQDHPGTNRRWPDVTCPRCGEANATSFEFTSYRRMWFACLACDQVWIGMRQE